MFCGPVFAEVCTGKGINHLLTNQVLLSGCEAKGAVYDSKGQEEDYTRLTQMKRGNLFSGN